MILNTFVVHSGLIAFRVQVMLVLGFAILACGCKVFICNIGSCRIRRRTVVLRRERMSTEHYRTWVIKLSRTV